MPSTFYAKLGRKQTRHPILPIDKLPRSYDSLKILLTEVACLIYIEHDQVTYAEVSLEQHLPGKQVAATASNAGKVLQQETPLIMGKGGYRQKRIHYRRGIEFLCKLTYNHLTESIKIKDAHFGNHTWKSMHEDYEAETGKKFYVAPVVPKSAVNMRGNTAAFAMMQPPEASTDTYQENTKPSGYFAVPEEYLQEGYSEPLELPYEEKETRLFKEAHFKTT
jgi:hypothetical protein